ncbi:MAG: hypothetical protein JWP37_3998 [Mucilaginibacter sp.]|nr:hypothetical protein [Mucilaginibacter sp.]
MIFNFFFPLTRSAHPVITSPIEVGSTLFTFMNLLTTYAYRFIFLVILKYEC